MSGIYIKGMEMPTDGAIEIQIFAEGKAIKSGYTVSIDGKDYYAPTLGETPAVQALPAADVRENKVGRWEITDAYPHNVYCSECHTKFAQTHWAVWEDGSLPRNYCPNCGAAMEGTE